MTSKTSSYQTLVEQFASSGGGIFASIKPQDIGLTLPYSDFVSLATAIMALPPVLPITAGELNKTTNGAALYYTYDGFTGLHVQAGAGFLSSASGNGHALPGDGGFVLNVLPNGQWALKFDGSDTILGSGISQPVPPPPSGNTVVDLPGTGKASYGPSVAGNTTVNGGAGYDTISGGVGDYMIGGTGTGGGGAGGQGNCAVYAGTTGSILTDMQDGLGYGGNAGGDVYVNINQVRGSKSTNVEIGSPNGTDLKSGGDDSLLVSLGGSGFELRADGTGNVLVSTVGADFINFDPNHQWVFGDDNILLGFGHGDVINLGQIVNYHGSGGGYTAQDFSNFFTTSAVGYSSKTGTGDINNYVKFVDQADGDHLLYSPTGQVKTGVNTTEILDLKLTHGLSAATLYQNQQLLMVTPHAYAG